MAGYSRTAYPQAGMKDIIGLGELDDVDKEQDQVILPPWKVELLDTFNVPKPTTMKDLERKLHISRWRANKITTVLDRCYRRTKRSLLLFPLQHLFPPHQRQALPKNMWRWIMLAVPESSLSQARTTCCNHAKSCDKCSMSGW
jgi:hypothetical protein